MIENYVSDMIVFFSTIVAAFITSYYAYRRMVKKNNAELKKLDNQFQSDILREVNEQNTKLRDYLQTELDKSLQKNKDLITEFENKIQIQKDRIDSLEREREKDKLKIFRIRLALIELGIEFSEEEDVLSEIEDGIKRLAHRIPKNNF